MADLVSFLWGNVSDGAREIRKFFSKFSKLAQWLLWWFWEIYWTSLDIEILTVPSPAPTLSLERLKEQRIVLCEEAGRFRNVHRLLRTNSLQSRILLKARKVRSKRASLPVRLGFVVRKGSSRARMPLGQKSFKMYLGTLPLISPSGWTLFSDR